MIFKSQQEAIAQLETLSKVRRQSVLIEGPTGCGKSYLARQYANMLGVNDFVQIEPKVSDIREAMDSILNIENDIVICIENLDKGVLSASYTMLKTLEEPLPNLYIVITCTNRESIPDTIISRSAVVTAGPPTSDDIELYAASKDNGRLLQVKNTLVWSCVRSFKSADSVLGMNANQLAFYNDLKELCKFRDSVSNIVWKISHYDSNTSSDIELVIQCIMKICNSSFISRSGVNCLQELHKGRVAEHAVLSKFIFDAKYCE